MIMTTFMLNIYRMHAIIVEYLTLALVKDLVIAMTSCLL